MIEDFKAWFLELQKEAIDTKKRKARDPTKWKKEIWKAPEKNKQIKERFSIEARSRDYKPRSSIDRKAREWLYDMTWREFDENGFLTSVVLTMEIELSDKKEKKIRYDFNKLLQADSEYKVFVFQQSSKHESDRMMKFFKEVAEKYKSKIGSKYLMCCWCTSRNEFRFLDFEISV